MLDGFVLIILELLSYRINTPRKQGGLGNMKIPLVADLTKSISRDYGVLKEDDGIAYRLATLLLSFYMKGFI